ncbi:MAG: DUF2625 family protein [Archangium sp.]|nr:DUF2625 family protein [Archangium sp.]
MQWAFGGSVHSFYEGLRWAGWGDEVGRLAPDQSMLISPFPSADGAPYEQRERSPVSVEEIWSLFVERLGTLNP